MNIYLTFLMLNYFSPYSIYCCFKLLICLSQIIHMKMYFIKPQIQHSHT